jgi:hypothetical protein
MVTLGFDLIIIRFICIHTHFWNVACHV